VPQRGTLRTDFAAQLVEVAMAARGTTNKRKREAAEQEQATRTDSSAKGRHAKAPGERSNGARRAISQGSNETRGGRERSERRGGSAVGKPRGRATHGRDGRPRAH
jgi:hypothetical protein